MVELSSAFLRLDGSDIMTFGIVYAKDLEQELSSENVELIDIRTEREFDQEHWEGAISLPLHETDSYEEILDKRKRIILYCQHGGNSMQLARYLGRRGYNVATVIGGYETMKKIRKTI